MDRLTVAEHHDRFARILREVERIGALIIIISLTGYVFSAWVWFQGQPWIAAFIATAGFLLFRTYRSLPLIIAGRLLKSQPGYIATFQALHQAIRESDSTSVLNQLHAIIRNKP